VYGFDCTGFSRKGTYDHWIYCSAILGDPMKFVKWKIASYYSAHKLQDIPPCAQVLLVDNPSILLGGRAYKWLRLMERTDIDMFESFITSVLYSKKGMPRPTKDTVKLSEKDAFYKLTKIVPERPVFLKPWSEYSNTNRTFDVESLLSIESLSQQIKRTVIELYSDTQYTEDDRIEPFFPSTSANYINTRSMGGVVGEILGNPEILKGLKTNDELIKTHFKSSNRNSSVHVDTSRLRLKFQHLYKRIVDKATYEEKPTAIPLGLAEALKVRVISKGPPYLYTMLKPLQRKLWKVLSQHPCFTLVGRPVDADYVQSRMGSKLKEDEYYLSVDYTDATNEMMSWASEAAVSALIDCLKLSVEEELAFKTALTGHFIEYDGVIRKQTMRQLMGSIVSFPILCIVNAAICRWAKELSSNRYWSLSDCPLAINGDDAIIRTNELGKRMWEKIGSFCGLSPSIGKVYFSKSFLNINSTTYTFYPEGWEGFQVYREGKKINRLRHFRLIPYVNLGLLFSLKRSGGSYNIQDSDENSSFGSRASALVTTSPYSIRERVLCQFIHLQSSKLSRARIPWFIPEQFGGLGLPCVGKYQPSNKELRLARMIYEHSDVFPIPQRPISAPWKVWQYATKRFPLSYNHFPHAVGFTAVKGERISMVSENHILGLFCVEALFRVDGISSLYKIQDANVSAMNKFLRLLQQIWKKALLSTIPFPEPFNQDNYPVKYTTSNLKYLFEHKDENSSFLLNYLHLTTII